MGDLIRTTYRKVADVLAEALKGPERAELTPLVTWWTQGCLRCEVADARLDEMLALLHQAHVQLDRLEGTASSIEQRLEP